jgi:Predicted coiled-coil domain-containing protein.
VLKKAVLEEQKQNGDLKQTLRSQEQSLRKNEQEMESLVFRNQQLTKRVTVLQDDLEEERKLAKKGEINLSRGVVSGVDFGSEGWWFKSMSENLV